MIARATAWIVDHARAVLFAVCAVSIALAVPLARLDTNVDFATYVDSTDPAYLLMDQAEARYGSQTLLMVAVASPDGVFNARTLAKVEALEAGLADIPGVAEVDGPLGRDVIVSSADALDVGPAAPGGLAPTTPETIAAYRDRVLGIQTMQDLLVASDESAIAILVRSDRDAPQFDVAKSVRAVVGELGTPPEKYSISGEAYMMLALTESIQGDLVVLIPIVLAAMCVVLFLSFRSLRGVWIPLLVVGLAVVWTFGPMALLGVPVSIITFVLPVLLLAIGIAYGIHVMHRVDEERARGVSRREAIVVAVPSIAGAVTMAGLTTMGGFLSLLTSSMPLFAEFGLIAAAGVGLALVLALVVVPAVLAVLPERPVKDLGEGRSRLGRVLGGLSRAAARRPRMVLVAALLLVGVLAATVPLIKTDSSMTGFLGEQHPAVLGMKDFDVHFSGAEQLRIEIDTGRRDGLKDPELLRRLIELETALRSFGVRKTASITDLVRELNLRFHDGDPAYNAIPDDRKQVSQLLALFAFQGGDLGAIALRDFSAGQIVGMYPRADGATKAQLVRDVRGYLRTHFADVAKADMVGPTQFFDAMSRQLIRSQITNIFSSTFVVGAIVAAIMGSVIAGLVSLIPLVFTVLAIFAVMSVAGITLNLASATIASITMGTGIDYAVHYVARVRNERRAGRNLADAAQKTAETAGRAIAFNAAAVMAGLLVLCLSRFVAFRSFGGLLALAMAASASAALTILPAALAAASPRFLTAAGWIDRIAQRRAHREQTSRRPS
ncbi:MAG: efflux RND transporter permease subunit [Candidatus Bipolaricaulota bacterium]